MQLHQPHSQHHLPARGVPENMTTFEDGALHHVYFFLEKTLPQPLEPAVTPDNVNTTALVESEHAPVRSDSDCSTVVNPEQAKNKECDLPSAFAAGASSVSDITLVDAASEDDDWKTVDTPSGDDDDMTTDGRLIKAASFLTTVASHLTAGGESDSAATCAKHDVSSDQSPFTDEVTHHEQPSSSEYTTARTIPQPAVKVPTEMEWQSMAADTLINSVAQDDIVEATANTSELPSNDDELEQKVVERSGNDLPEVKEPPRVDSAAELSTTAVVLSPFNAAGQDANTSTPATASPQKFKQPSLFVTTTAGKTTPVPSTHSSPSKTTPLSVSAAEFVPFGPARPPGILPVTTTGPKPVAFGPVRPPGLSPTITAAAAEFVPSTQTPATYVPPHHREPRRKGQDVTPFFEQRTTPDKGVGLFALKKIPIGTRIICEDALLKLPYNDVALTLQAYRKLSKQKKKIYDSLPPYAPENLDLKKEILLNIGNVDEKTMTENVRVLAIFAANDFMLGDHEQVGVFEKASRINHSCIPNVVFSNNRQLGCKETVHAARDIEEGEELLANYIGGKANYQRAEERQAYLKRNYGFECKCDACSDSMLESDTLREVCDVELRAKEEMHANLLIDTSRRRLGSQPVQISRRDHCGRTFPQSLLPSFTNRRTGTSRRCLPHPASNGSGDG